MKARQEADRLEKSGWLSSLLSRPEIGPLGVMLLLFGMLGYFSIPTGGILVKPICRRGI